MGFPSPAADYLDCGINYRTEVFQFTGPSCFVYEVDETEGCEMQAGALLVCERDCHAMHGDTVLIEIGGEKFIRKVVLGRRPGLTHFNGSGFVPFDDDNEIVVLGLVKTVIHRLRRFQHDDGNPFI
ncbi:hypothetical protein [Dryocola sp. BD626]|uniref:hypothetical protein n=1 Tax=Dryocola sp. BD626 TaxID=3133273 RepID=UPI003F4F5A80